MKKLIQEFISRLIKTIFLVIFLGFLLVLSVSLINPVIEEEKKEENCLKEIAKSICKEVPMEYLNSEKYVEDGILQTPNFRCCPTPDINNRDLLLRHPLCREYLFLEEDFMKCEVE